LPGEDTHGFRAIAQRSMIADAGKDSGAVSMFPPLADEWYQQSKLDVTGNILGPVTLFSYNYCMALTG